MKSFSSRAHIGICENAPRPLNIPVSHLKNIFWKFGDKWGGIDPSPRDQCRFLGGVNGEGLIPPLMGEIDPHPLGDGDWKFGRD